LNQSSITPDIVKNPRRGQTVTIQKQDNIYYRCGAIAAAGEHE
jgi:hypothetical protein